MHKTSVRSAVGQAELLWDVGATGSHDDAALLRRFVSRGAAAEAAFATLVQRHGPMVLRVCSAVLDNVHDAHDAAQATFLVLASKARTIRRTESLASWLFGTAHRAASQVRRETIRRRRRERIYAENRTQEHRGVIERDDSPLDSVDLVNELNRLPGPLRAAIVLCDLQGLTHDQAANHLDCPIRTLQTRLYRGRERIRQRLLQRGLTPAAGVVALSLTTETLAVPPAWTAATTVLACAENTQAAQSRAADIARVVLRNTRLGTFTAVVTTTLTLIAVAAGLIAWPQPPAAGKAAAQIQKKSERPAPRPAKSRDQDAFERTYVLADGENLRAFRPPATEVRIQHDMAKSKRARNDAERLGHVHSYFRWRKQASEWYTTIADGTGPPLRNVLLPVLGLQPQEAEGDLKLLTAPIIGDFLVREGVAAEMLVPPLQTILRRDFALPVKLSLGNEERTVIVVSGKYQFKPDPTLDPKELARAGIDPLEVYAHEVDQPGVVLRGYQASGYFAGFLSDLATHIGLRVVDEVESSPKGFIGWHITGYKLGQPINEDDRKRTFEHLTAQTGLTFREAKRTVRVLSVEREE